MSHDLKQEFRSPTVNLFFKKEDFLKYVSDLKRWNECDLIDITGESTYPIGLLGGEIEVFFLHYKTFENAKESWIRRCKRINYDNVHIIMADTGLTDDEFEIFDKISYKKIMFTNNRDLKFDWICYIKGFEKEKHIGNTIPYWKFGKRFYEQFDYIKWLNH